MDLELDGKVACEQAEAGIPTGPRRSTGGVCKALMPGPHPVPAKTAIPRQGKAKGRPKRPSGPC